MSARRSAAPDPAIVSPVLTTQEACRYLDCGRTYLSQHADEIGVIRKGGRGSKLRFLREDLDNWLLRDRAQTAPAAVETEPRREPTPILRGLDIRNLGGVNPVDGRPWDAVTRKVSR